MALAIVDGIGRGLVNVKAGNLIPHDEAITELGAPIGRIVAVKLFEERVQRADLEWFDRFMNRKGGEPPRAGDELPEGYVRRGLGEVWELLREAR